MNPTRPDAQIKIPLRFQPGNYGVRRDGGTIVVELHAPEHQGGRALERVWEVGERPNFLNVQSTAANRVDEVVFRASESTGGDADAAGDAAFAWPETAAAPPADGVEALLDFDSKPLAELRRTDQGWVTQLVLGAEPNSWWQLADGVVIGVTDDGLLTALQARVPLRVTEPQRLTFDPTLAPRSYVVVDGDVAQAHVDYGEEGFDEESDDDDDSDTEADTYPLPFSEEAVAGPMNDWIAGKVDEMPTLEDIEGIDGEVDDTADCVTPDGSLEMWTSLPGRFYGLRVEARRGAVQFIDDPERLDVPVDLLVDLSAGATGTWAEGSEPGSVDLDVRIGDEPPRLWLQCEQMLLGVAGDRLVALQVHDAKVHVPGDGDDDADDDHADEMWSDPFEDHNPVQFFRERLEQRALDDRDSTPPFPVFGLSGWDGKVWGGPEPDDDRDEISLRYGDPFAAYDAWQEAGADADTQPPEDDPPEIEIENARRADPHALMVPPGHDQDAMWIAHHANGEFLRSVETESDARRAFAQVEKASRELASRGWATDTIKVDGTPQAARVLEDGDAWVAKTQVQGTYVTVRSWRHPRESTQLTQLIDLAPFIEGSCRMEERQLEQMQQAEAQSPDMFSPSGDTRTIMRTASRFFSALEGAPRQVCKLLAPGITEMHGGEAAYMRLLGLYQAAALHGGGGMSGDVRVSPDGNRAAVSLHKSIPTASDDDAGWGHGSISVSFAVSTAGDEPPAFPEPSPDDVRLEDANLDITLRLIRIDDEEWCVSTDILGELMRVLGPPNEIVKPRQ